MKDSRRLTSRNEWQLNTVALLRANSYAARPTFAAEANQIGERRRRRRQQISSLQSGHISLCSCRAARLGANCSARSRNGRASGAGAALSSEQIKFALLCLNGVPKVVRRPAQV